MCIERMITSSSDEEHEILPLLKRTKLIISRFKTRLLCYHHFDKLLQLYFNITHYTANVILYDLFPLFCKCNICFKINNVENYTLHSILEN